MAEGFPTDFPDLDVLIASAVNYLLQADERDQALMLLQSEVRLNVSMAEDDRGLAYSGEVFITLIGPRKVYDALNIQDYGSLSERLWNAFRAVLPDRYALMPISGKAQLLDALASDWRNELQTRAFGQSVSNQGVEIPNREYVTWQRLRFRSRAEVLVAEALEAANVLFLPNCMARLGPGGQQAARYTKEADFLVCAGGKWGVLEVDGSQHAGAAARDHERDRLFKHHGIKVIERFTARECYGDAAGVVKGFLDLLARNG